MKVLFVGLSLAVYLALLPPPAEACSAFLLRERGNPQVGQSYDWFLLHGHGAAFLEPAGVRRKGAALKGNVANAAEWTSVYRSVTFTQFGRGLPVAGMNDQGLTVVALQLDDTRYNSGFTDLPFVNEAQWGQYQLDKYATVEEVWANAKAPRIEKAFIGLHFLIADSRGDAMLVEFLDGELLGVRGRYFSVPATTNDTYLHLVKDAIDNWKLGEFEAFQMPPPPKWARTSEVRYRTISRDLRRGFHAKDILDRVDLNGLAPDALLEVSQWGIVYHPAQGKIEFKTRSNPTWKTLDFTLLPTDQRLAMDMNQPEAGPAESRFEPYTDTFNRKLIEKNEWLLDQTALDRAAEVGTQ